MTAALLTPPPPAVAGARRTELLPGDREAAVRRAAEEFEAVFLSQVLAGMFAGVADDGPFSAGPGGAAFRSMLHDEFAKIISRAGGIGLADAIMRELLNAQEVTSDGR
jgi:peptidoglycan hydrolase FlgJ